MSATQDFWFYRPCKIHDHQLKWPGRVAQEGTLRMRSSGQLPKLACFTRFDFRAFCHLYAMHHALSQKSFDCRIATVPKASMHRSIEMDVVNIAARAVGDRGASLQSSVRRPLQMMSTCCRYRTLTLNSLNTLARLHNQYMLILMTHIFLPSSFVS